MGTRGPIPKRGRTAAAKTRADGRLRTLPDGAPAIFRRLARDIDGLTAADAALLEDMARWAAIAQSAYAQLGATDATGLALTMTDTGHGDGRESRKNPLLIVLRTASEQIRANAQQLGATPMARARLPQPEEGEMSLAEILFQGVGVERG